MWAVGEGHPEIVKALLDAGADVNTKNSNGYTALSLVPAKRLFSIPVLGEFYRNERNKEITQLLKKEVFMNSDQQSGVDVNAWIAAAANGNTAAVKSLLANGIGVDTKTPSLTALMWAASGGHTDTVRVLLDADADVNAMADDGSTPLMHAVLSGNVDTVKVLLDAGADVHTKNNIGVTALSIVPGERSSSFALGRFLFNVASKSRQGNIAQLLKEAGAVF